MDIKNRIFSSTGGVFRAFCYAVWQWYTEHQTGNAPKAIILLFFYQTVFLQWSQYWSRCRSLARARYGNPESKIENRYCTREKKRSPSKKQLMQCKSFELLAISWARYGNPESRIENRYCTREKKRSPSEEQLMQYKSFKLLRIANSGLQPVKELLRSVQIIKELWRPVSHGDCRTTHKVE